MNPEVNRAVNSAVNLDVTCGLSSAVSSALNFGVTCGLNSPLSCGSTSGLNLGVTCGLTSRLNSAVTCGFSREVNSGVSSGLRCRVKSEFRRAVIAQVTSGILMQVLGQGLTRSQAHLRWRDTVRNRRRGTVPGARRAAIRDSPRDFGSVPLRVPGQGVRTTRVVAVRSAVCTRITQTPGRIPGEGFQEYPDGVAMSARRQAPGGRADSRAAISGRRSLDTVSQTTPTSMSK